MSVLYPDACKTSHKSKPIFVKKKKRRNWACPTLRNLLVQVLLGIDALGINFYDVGNKFSPKVSFPWSEIQRVSYDKDKFKVSLTADCSHKWISEPDGSSGSNFAGTKSGDWSLIRILRTDAK